jgi:hypothetical protein
LSLAGVLALMVSVTVFRLGGMLSFCNVFSVR